MTEIGEHIDALAKFCALTQEKLEQMSEAEQRHVTEIDKIREQEHVARRELERASRALKALCGDDEPKAELDRKREAVEQGAGRAMPAYYPGKDGYAV